MYLKRKMKNTFKQTQRKRDCKNVPLKFHNSKGFRAIWNVLKPGTSLKQQVHATLILGTSTVVHVIWKLNPIISQPQYFDRRSLTCGGHWFSATTDEWGAGLVRLLTPIPFSRVRGHAVWVHFSRSRWTSGSHITGVLLQRKFSIIKVFNTIYNFNTLEYLLKYK